VPCGISAQQREAHSFASSPFDEFALSRVKGVLDPGKTRGLASKIAAKTGNFVSLTKPRSRFGETQVKCPNPKDPNPKE